ncbi:MAG: lipase [Opitutaceae bacterium]|nr:lipase [Opitutaceae bacterium]
MKDSCFALPHLLRPLLLALALTTQILASPPATDALGVSPAHQELHYSGRTGEVAAGQVALGWSGARVRLRFKGTAVSMRMIDDTKANFVLVRIDGERRAKLRLDAPDGTYNLATGLPPGEHTVEIVRVTEAMLGLPRFLGFTLSPGASVLPWGREPDRRILFVGDSITCGYGVEVDDPKLRFTADTENFCDGYTGLTVEALQADYVVVSRSGIGMLRNYNGPREGNPDAMPAIYPRQFFQTEQPRWKPDRFKPQVICINLGTNDFSTSGPDVDKFVAAYRQFTTQLLQQYPRAKLVLLQGPMNNRAELRDALRRVQATLPPKLAPRVSYFELTAQGPLGFGADWHPSRAQSQRNAAELTAHLRQLMAW